MSNKTNCPFSARIDQEEMKTHPFYYGKDLKIEGALGKSKKQAFSLLILTSDGQVVLFPLASPIGATLFCYPMKILNN